MLQNSLARVSLPPHSSNTNLRGILHLVLVGDTSSVEHSLVKSVSCWNVVEEEEAYLGSRIVMLTSDLC